MQGYSSDTDRNTPSLRWILLYATSAITAVLILVLGIVLSLHFAPANAAANKHASVKTAALRLTILAPMTMPNGSVIGPLYTPYTDLVVPAHTLVTVTIVNQDLGDTPLPPNSPYTTVTGATDGIARVDGIPYTKLDPTKVAHTFTIQQLGINIPIPGDSATGQSSLTVTFSFMTGSSGYFTWRCMDPCGTGPSGWQGPMASTWEMMGTLAVA